MEDNKNLARESNMELLRIIAMLFILIGHANYVAFDRVTIADGVSEHSIALTRMWIQAVTVSGVNIFVLISGWFSISFKWKKLAALIFEVLFFNILIYIVLVLSNLIPPFSLKDMSTILMLNGSDLWFVKAYIGLFLISPALNSFVEHCTEKQMRILLISFFVFQSLYGWLDLYGAEWIEGGFSAWSFIGLYLMARYVRIFQPAFLRGSVRVNLLKWLLILSLLALASYILLAIGIDIQGRIICSYTNPFMILSATFLVSAFSKIHFSSRIINNIATSCFAVYLLHANELVLRTYYGPFFKYLFDQYPLALFLIYTVLTLISVFIISILIDKLRIYLWNLTNKTFFR